MTEMGRKNLFLVLVLLILLAAAVYLARPSFLGWKKETKLLFAGFKPETVTEIRIKGVKGEKGDKEAEERLIKEGEKWLVESKDNFPADEELVEKALAAVSKMEIGEVASLRKEKWEEFGVKEEGLRVIIVLPAPVQFWVGKAGRDYNSTYVRKIGDEKVYLVKGSLGSVFGVKDWRDLRVFGEAGEIRGLKFKYPNRQLTVEKTGEKWMIVEPVEMEAAKNRVEFVLDGLKRLRAIDATASAELANFSDPEIELTVVSGGDGKNGGDKMNEEVLLIDAKDESGQNRYARLKDGEIIYLISAADAASFEKKAEDFLPPNKN